MLFNKQNTKQIDARYFLTEQSEKPAGYDQNKVKVLQGLLSKYFNLSAATKQYFATLKADPASYAQSGVLGAANDPRSTQYLINAMRATKHAQGQKSGVPARDPKKSIDQNLDILIQAFSNSLNRDASIKKRPKDVQLTQVV